MRRWLFLALALLWTLPASAQQQCLGDVCNGGVGPTRTDMSGAWAGLNYAVYPLAQVQATTLAALPFAPVYNNGNNGQSATLTATVAGTLIIDGYSPMINDRILVNNQALPYQNGIYVVTATGNAGTIYGLVRSNDASPPAPFIQGALVTTVNGTVNAGVTFIMTSRDINYGNSPISFSVFIKQVPLNSGTGTVTSVSLSMPPLFAVAGSPITTSGGFTVTLTPQMSNLLLASPNGASGPPTFRSLVGADFGSQPQNLFLGSPNGSSGNATFRAIASADLSGSFTGITGTGTLTAGATGAGFTIALGASTITGGLPLANIASIANNRVLANVSGSSAAPVAVGPGLLGQMLFSVPALFGSSPWVDVKSGQNSCAAAVGNNSTDDTAAIQCQLTWIYNNLGGGIVFFPAAAYKITSTLTVKGPTCLIGANPALSALVISTDTTAINYDATASNACFNNMEAVCYLNTAATVPCINITAGANRGTWQYFNVQGGSVALSNNGAVWQLRNGTLNGYATTGGGANSTGANYYSNVYFDTGGNTTTFAFKQLPNAATQENFFTDCDFSGSYTDSVVIADTNHLAITHFAGSVFSSAIALTGARATMITGSELGANLTISGGGAGGVVSVVSSYGLSAVTATGASCAGNNSITC